MTNLMDLAKNVVLILMGFPKEYRKQISSTNPKERLNTVGVYPNVRAIIRLVGTMTVGPSDGWHLSRRNMRHECLDWVISPELEFVLTD